MILQRVIRIIREFPEYVEVVISCTRKTDFELWDVLFAVAGDPQQLMEVGIIVIIYVFVVYCIVLYCIALYLYSR